MILSVLIRWQSKGKLNNVNCFGSFTFNLNERNKGDAFHPISSPTGPNPKGTKTLQDISDLYLNLT